MTSINYIGDEINELVAENQLVKQELELTKMMLERKDAENVLLRAQIADMRAIVEEKSSETASLYMLLEQQAQSLSMGIQKFRRQKEAREATHEQRVARENRRVETQAIPASAPPRAASRAKLNDQPLPEDERPLFLQPKRGMMADHPLLPELEALAGSEEGRVQ